MIGKYHWPTDYTNEWSREGGRGYGEADRGMEHFPLLLLRLVPGSVQLDGIEPLENSNALESVAPAMEESWDGLLG